MGIGEPKMPTPEEMADTQKQRTLSDAELIKDGAEYKFNKKGKSTLEFTEEQRKDAEREMNKSIDVKDKSELIQELKDLKKENEQLKLIRFEDEVFKRAFEASSKIKDFVFAVIIPRLKNCNDNPVLINKGGDMIGGDNGMVYWLNGISGEYCNVANGHVPIDNNYFPDWTRADFEELHEVVFNISTDY